MAAGCFCLPSPLYLLHAPPHYLSNSPAFLSEKEKHHQIWKMNKSFCMACIFVPSPCLGRREPQSFLNSFPSFHNHSESLHCQSYCNTVMPNLFENSFFLPEAGEPVVWDHLISTVLTRSRQCMVQLRVFLPWHFHTHTHCFLSPNSFLGISAYQWAFEAWPFAFTGQTWHCGGLSPHAHLMHGQLGGRLPSSPILHGMRQLVPCLLVGRQWRASSALTCLPVSI